MVYLFQHPETDEIKEIVQPANAKHEYFENGVQWRRVYTIPCISISTKFDAFSEKQFLRKTHEMKNGTIGDLLDLAQEAREERVKIDGYDKFGKETNENYKKKTGKDLADYVGEGK